VIEQLCVLTTERTERYVGADVRDVMDAVILGCNPMLVQCHSVDEDDRAELLESRAMRSAHKSRKSSLTAVSWKRYSKKLAKGALMRSIAR
jgi:hypothetical protein